MLHPGGPDRDRVAILLSMRRNNHDKMFLHAATKLTQKCRLDAMVPGLELFLKRKSYNHARIPLVADYIAMIYIDDVPQFLICGRVVYRIRM